MFEMIGVLFGIVVLLLVAGLLSVVFAGVAWLVLRRVRLPRRVPMILGAAILPFASAAYCWLCVALLPGESLFGDIYQPLPNGFALVALGKMPDSAAIGTGSTVSGPQVPLTEDIGSLATEGPLVIGHYSHPFSSFEAKPQEPYFILDTKTAMHTDYPDMAALHSKLGHAVHLVATDQFRSTEPGYVKQQRSNRIIMFTPPIAATVLYMGLLLGARRIKRT